MEYLTTVPSDIKIIPASPDSFMNFSICGWCDSEPPALIQNRKLISHVDMVHIMIIHFFSKESKHTYLSKRLYLELPAIHHAHKYKVGVTGLFPSSRNGCPKLMAKDVLRSISTREGLRLLLIVKDVHVALFGSQFCLWFIKGNAESMTFSIPANTW